MEYFRHAKGWCAFIVTSNAVTHVPLPLLNDDLLERLRTWVMHIESPAGRGKLSYKPLYQLHDAVITPIREYLPLSGAVVLAPFGPLHLIPIAM